MSFQEKYNEYKERQEAKNYFRSNNDQFLDTNQWIKTIAAGLLGAIVMGVVHGLLTMKIMIDSSLFYIVIGYAMANIITSVSRIQSPAMGYTSAILTFITFFISKMMLVIPIVSIGGDILTIFSLIPFVLQLLFTSNIIDLIFVVIGVFVAYQQAQ